MMSMGDNCQGYSFLASGSLSPLPPPPFPPSPLLPRLRGGHRSFSVELTRSTRQERPSGRRRCRELAGSRTALGALSGWGQRSFPGGDILGSLLAVRVSPPLLTPLSALSDLHAVGTPLHLRVGYPPYRRPIVHAVLSFPGRLTA